MSSFRSYSTPFLYKKFCKTWMKLYRLRNKSLYVVIGESKGDDRQQGRRI